jgi:hypothetical protein
MGKFMLGTRLAVTGKAAGPDLMEVISFLGGTEVSARIYRALELFTISAQ